MDLIETSRLMRSQSNRHTQFPLFIIQNKNKVYEEDGDEIEWLSDDWEELEEDDVCESCREDGIHAMRRCADCKHPDRTPRLYSWKWQMDDRAGVFFTEKACHDHLESNNYHYNNPRSYVISAWRNPEMIATMQMILKLTGDEIPSHYK